MKRSVLVFCLWIVLSASVFADVGGALPGFAGGNTGDPFAAMEGRSLSSMEELAAIVGARPEPYYYEEAEERAEDPDREEMRHFLHAKAVSRRLVTQYDLRDCKVKDWNQACKFLTLISGPQIDSGNIWSEAETIEAYKYMQKQGWVLNEFYVHDSDKVIDYAAKMCGFSGGSSDYYKYRDFPVRYLEMFGYTANNNKHFNLHNLDGDFIWDPYNGEPDRILIRKNTRTIRFD